MRLLHHTIFFVDCATIVWQWISWCGRTCRWTLHISGLHTRKSLDLLQWKNLTLLQYYATFFHWSKFKILRVCNPERYYIQRISTRHSVTIPWWWVWKTNALNMHISMDIRKMCVSTEKGPKICRFYTFLFLHHYDHYREVETHFLITYSTQEGRTQFDGVFL